MLKQILLAFSSISVRRLNCNKSALYEVGSNDHLGRTYEILFGSTLGAKSGKKEI